MIAFIWPLLCSVLLPLNLSAMAATVEGLPILLLMIENLSFSLRKLWTTHEEWIGKLLLL